MKNGLFKKILPHLIALIAFLIVSVWFCRPALEGNVLNQHDIVGWKGMAQNAFDYKEKNGHFPLWNTNVFSGMPNYMIAMEGKNVLPDLNKIFSLGLPQPINFFFLACVCFYILCLALKARPLVAVFGAFAYAFATYNPVIISAGHVTKMFAIAYMPLLLSGIILTYEKRYWMGLALTTLGAYMELSANHPQINYYFFIIAGAVTIAYLVSWIRKNEWKHTAIALGITAVAAGAGLATNSLSFLTAKEYAKATMRGGKNISIEADTVKAEKTEGLDTSYAFQYSLSQTEPLVMLMPDAFGGSSSHPLDENTAVVKKLTDKGIPENTAGQVAGVLSRYWGGLESTSGTPYMGVLVCLLALVGFVVVRHPLRWALLAVSVFGILLSWGRFFPGFNTFIFEHMPLYNKFRAPSMALVILQLALPIMAVLTVQQLVFAENSKQYLKNNFKKVLYAVGGLAALLVILYLTMDYSSPSDAYTAYRLKSMGADDEIVRTTISGLKADRNALFGSQLLRTIGFMALLLALLWMYIKNALKPLVILGIIGVVTLIDLLVVDTKYLNEDNYRSADEAAAATITKTPIDEQILQDKSHYRVYNAGRERFSAEDYHVSTFHKAVGGYHPAKLRIYQDIIERYLSGGDARQILNMLNAKYIIFPNPQTGQPTLTVNPDAYGPCWLVKHVQIVKDDVEEIQALDKTNLRDTAIVQESFAKQVTQPVWDSTASIALSKFDNDAIEYTATASAPQFAVFSEVYYAMGWNAYLDGKKVDYAKTDYVLRGISVPPGKHTIRFAFEPATYKKGATISYIGSFLVLILVLGGFAMAWREQKRKQAPVAKS